MLQPGATFDLTLTWAGSPPLGGVDYAVLLNTNQLVLTGRSFHASLASRADTLYLPTLPAATSRVDLSWFTAAGFTGTDVTLHFQVPANYTGPGTVTVNLAVAGAVTPAAADLAVTTAATTVSIQESFIDATSSDSATAVRTVNWVAGTPALAWSPSTPGLSGLPDRATVTLSNTLSSGDYGIDLNQNLTLNKLTVNMGATMNFRVGSGTRRAIRWVDRGGQSAVLEFVRQSNSPLRNFIDSNSVLDTDLYIKLAHQGSKDSNVGGIVSGTGKLTIEYFNNVNNSSSTTTGYCLIGTAGDPASTHAGGTRLVMSAATVTTANFPFRAAKSQAFGSGPLELNKVRLDLNTYAQTVGGLADGANGSSITDAATSTGTTTLSLDFSNAAGTQTFAGAINDGTTRKLALTKSGTGTQVLTAAQGFTGATQVNGGTLRVNGSLAAASNVSVAATATLGGTGTINGPTNNQGTLAPGASVGTLAMAAVTMATGAKLETELANWSGTTPGTHWDHLTCASLTIQGALTIRLLPASLANFTESNQSFTIATSQSPIAGFNPANLTIDASAMPGTGSWTAQLDPSGTQLQITYSVSPNNPPQFAGLTAATGYQVPLSIPLATILAAASDPDDDGISITSAGPASANGGNATLGTSAILYTPPASFSGSDSFAITLTDTRGATTNATITVTVAPAENLANSRPTATFTGSHASLALTATPGASYSLERSTDGMASWQTVTTLTADSNGNLQWSDPGTFPSAYYRFKRP